MRVPLVIKLRITYADTTEEYDKLRSSGSCNLEEKAPRCDKICMFLSFRVENTKEITLRKPTYQKTTHAY